MTLEHLGTTRTRGTARVWRAVAGASALAVLALATPAAAQDAPNAPDARPDRVTVPGTYGRILECAAEFDIDCPVLPYAATTDDFRGTFDLPAGAYEYYAFVTTGSGSAGYGPTGAWTGDFYSLAHPGGPVTFVYDPATRIVTIEGAVTPGQPGPQYSLTALLTIDNTAAGALSVGLDVPAGAQVFTGDWDGDGIDTLAWRVGNRFTFTTANEDGGGGTFGTWYGLPTDEVLVGDWDGDGRDTIGVRRGNQFHLANAFTGRADSIFWYGLPSDEVVVGDFDGDGRDTVSVRRGNGFHINNALKGGNADRVVFYGRPGEAFLIGDIDGDGTDGLVIRRGNEYHLKNSLATGNAERVVRLGAATDTALLGDWDGDGVDTLGIGSH